MRSAGAISPGSGAMLRSTRPASSSVVIGAEPLYGTCSMSMPALVLNSSPPDARPSRCPPSRRHAPGLALAIATTSPTLWLRNPSAPPALRHCGDAGDRREILHGIERPALDQTLVGGVGLVGAEDQRVAVGFGAGHGAGADNPEAPGRFSTTTGCLRSAAASGDQPRQAVDRPAGRAGTTMVMARLGNDCARCAERQAWSSDAGKRKQNRGGSASLGLLQTRSRCEISTTRARRASSSPPQAGQRDRAERFDLWGYSSRNRGGPGRGRGAMC